MAKVTNLQIIKQEGADNTYFATWEFREPPSATAASSSVIAGCTVSINSNATYYNGVAIPSGVKSRQFKVKSVSGDRAVLGGSTDGQYADINSPVKTSNLTVVSGGGSTSTSSTKTLDHFIATWHYNTGQKRADGTNIWFEGDSQEVTETKSQTYNPPDNTDTFRITVKPVSKTYKVKSGDTEVDKSYWSGENERAYKAWSTTAPADLSGAPSVEIKEYTLTATVEGIEDSRTDAIQFEVYNGTTKESSGKVDVKLCKAVYTCRIKAGGKYVVRCRAVNKTGGSEVYSNWTIYSSEQLAPAATVTGLKCYAESKDQIRLTWNESPSATGYDIQYTTKTKYFDTSNEVQSTSVEKSTTAYISAESGHTYYFRVRAKNDGGEVSGWSDIVSGVIGTKPEAPTTWSLRNNVIVGDDIVLYWVHNSQDASKMHGVKIRLTVDGISETLEPHVTVNEDEEEPIHSYTFDTSAYKEGATIEWEICTRGVLADYSEWSTVRTINLYANPTVNVSLSTNDQGQLTSFPLSITAATTPSTQKPISFHVSIRSTESYETVDSVGNSIFVGSGTEIYSKVFVTSDQDLSRDISAGDVPLVNSQSYNITVTVSMNSGLTATSTESFLVKWDEFEYVPDASIGIDSANLSAYISPYCMDYDQNLPTDVTLSVYRREFNGTFKAIATGILNNGVETVVDPHPSLDYARYRIVAQSSTTGAVSYTDLPGHPVNESAIIIQWDEQWTEFNYLEDAPAETPPWTGSMLKFPYNVDVNEKYAPDVALVNYIGREHPVSYFGTHRGETASWSATIPATDKETIYGLRRLASWRGNVYVREPSGTGYWATVSVSFPQKHKELTISVTFDITRVEGGI